MARKLDQILVVDVESNCWDGPPPDGQESEMIEIGVCSRGTTKAAVQSIRSSDIVSAKVILAMEPIIDEMLNRSKTCRPDLR